MRSHSFKPCHGYQSIDMRGLTDSLSEGKKEPQCRRPFSWPLPSVNLSSFELLQFSAFFFELTHVFRLCFSAISVSFRFVSLLFLHSFLLQLLLRVQSLAKWTCLVAGSNGPSLGLCAVKLLVFQLSYFGAAHPMCLRVSTLLDL